jgi:hypothetical protein
MSTSIYAVVALFDGTEVGTTIARSTWPPHVTLVSNFAVEASPELVVEAVQGALVGEAPREACLAGPAMFGPRGDVPVQLVESGQFPALHERLAAAAEHLPGFAADEPRYWHDGYRPHITRRIGETLREGDVWPIRCIATAALTETHGTVIGLIDLAPA